MSLSRNICGLDFDLMVEVGEIVKKKRERENFNKTIAYINHMRIDAMAREAKRCNTRHPERCYWEDEWINPYYHYLPKSYIGHLQRFYDFVGLYETDTWEGRELYTDRPYSETYW